jgi:predicted  nucleic acid-binding Zn-ribbon protein
MFSPKIHALCGAFVIALLDGGCSKNPSSPDAASFQQEFKATAPEVKGFAEQAVAAEEKQDYGTAFIHYRALSLNPDLTPEQRNAANDSMVKMNQKLRERATNGDANAEKILEMYRATK